MLPLVCRALCDQAPEYIIDMLQVRINVQTMHSTVFSQLAVSRNRLKGFGNRAFSIAAPRLWNALPGSISHCKSIGV